jgi:Predicted signal transduction protein with a C-terminal ATPase domain
MPRSVTRMLFTFIMLSAFFLIAAVGYFYFVYTKDMADQIRKNAEITLENTAVHASVILSDVKESAAFIATQPDLYQFATASADARHQAQNHVRSLLTSFADFKLPVVNVYLYTFDQTTLAARSTRGAANLSEAFGAYRKMVNDYDLTTPFREQIVTPGYEWQPEQYAYAVLTPIYPALPAPKLADYRGALITFCDIQRLFDGYPPVDNHSLLITDGNRILYTNDTAFRLSYAQEPNAKTLEIDGVESVILSQGIQGTNWRMVLAYPPESTSPQFRNARSLFAIVAFGLLLVQAALMMILYRRIVSPVLDIARQTEVINDGLGQIINPTDDRNELQSLTQGINQMLSRINQLNGSVLSMQRQHYEQRILFLQAQINPHFLYNNLECVRGMATMGNEAAVREIVSCVANIYRYCSQSEPTVPFRGEMDCLNLYSRILALRYDKRYTLLVKSTSEAELCAIPRMTLQPLVENCVRHGFEKNNREKGLIEIQAWRENEFLHVTVDDDGAGMLPEALAALNDTMRQPFDITRRHIGIANVLSRISFIFGIKSGAVFEASPLGGLRVHLMIYEEI